LLTVVTFGGEAKTKPDSKTKALALLSFRRDLSALNFTAV
jgi:hypothetical protein